MTTPPIIARAAQKRQKKMQQGTLLSFTTLAHPPSAFGSSPRTIGLLELDDGSKVLAPMLTATPEIGMRFHPRLRLSQINEQGLRMYDVSYEPIIGVPLEKTENFHGYILALTGPSGVGKSTVSRLLMHMFDEYVAPVPIVTTRGRKKGDDGEYRYVSKTVFTNLRTKGDIVAWTHIPSSGEDRWYGYRRSDIEKIWKQGKLPVVITEMHLLQGLAQHFGRRSILSFGLLPPGRSKRKRLSALLHRLRERGRETEEHIHDRLKNAERDLEFFKERRDLFDRLLVNEDVHAVVEMLRKHIPGLQA